MFKTKLCGLAIAFMIGCAGISPASVIAAETTTGTATMSEKDKAPKDNQSSFEDTIKKAEENWNKLTDKQKTEVYTLLESEMKAEIKLMDKLVDLGVLDKKDAAYIKARMQEKLEEIKKSGEFPLSKPKRGKKQ